VEARACTWIDVVVELGWDRLGAAGGDDDIERGSGLGLEANLALLHLEEPPRPCRDAMRTAKCRGHRLGVPRCGRSLRDEAVGQLGAVAQRAVERLTDPAGALHLVLDPGCLPERRIVPDVLAVQARELGHPVALVIETEAGHRAVHALS